MVQKLDIRKRVEGLIEKLDEPKPSPELKILLKRVIRRHLHIRDGAELFIENFNESLPDDISFEELLSVKHIRTTTGHPTEFMGADAIAELKKLFKLLEKERFPDYEITEALENFVKKLNIIPERKVIEQETTDSIIGSENLYDALGITAENIFKVSKKRRLIKLENGCVKAEDLEKCNNIMEVRTWSPGDSDNKPAQDYQAFTDGVRRNIEAIYRQYIIKVAEISYNLEKGPAKDKATQILENLVATMVKKSGKKEGALKKLRAHIRNNGNGVGGLVETAIDNHSDAGADYYRNASDITRDLFELKDFENQGTRFAKEKKGNVLTALDSLLISVQNFDGHAQKIEYRQNAEILREVASRVRELSLATGLTGTALRVELEKQADAFGEDFYNVCKGRLDKGGEINEQDKDNFYFIDTVKKLRIIAKNPEAFKSILIAECGEKSVEGKAAENQSVSDFNDTKYLFDTMTAGLPTAETARNNVKVTPLFEYNTQIKELPKFLHALIQDPVALAHFQQHGLEIMIAGSDSFKSAGSSVVGQIKGGIAAMQEICEANGINLTIYFGTGSSLHRNIIPIKPDMQYVQTQQGIALGRTAIDVACEFMRNLSNGLRRKLCKEHKGISLTEAVIDVGNSASTANMPSNEAGLRVNAGRRHEEYKSKYKSPWFASLVDNCLPNQIDAMFSFAARPAKRIGGSAESGPGPKRAIGFGQIMNNAGWGAIQLYTDLSDLFYAEKDGSLSSHNLQSSYEMYMGKAHMRDIINRGIDALALSSPDTGWQYIAAKFGVEIEVSRDYKNFATLKIKEEEFNISDLISNGETQKKLSSHLKDHRGAAQAIYAATFIELEHQKALRSTYQMLSYGLYESKVRLSPADKENAPLVARNLGKRDPDFSLDQPVTSEDLIKLVSVINKARGTELAEVREDLTTARGTLLETFRKQISNTELTGEDKLRAYHAFGICRSIYELPPATLQFPEIAKTKGIKRAA